uniref:Steroid sulfatase (microsomal), isozyme S n=1 Tax=Neogobius melanostomus TaxID=47308 RepID=A0A8C6TPX8_9GOBI
YRYKHHFFSTQLCRDDEVPVGLSSGPAPGFVSDLNPVSSSDSERPNFVLIMVDDMGMGDLGCYGNKTLKTPNVDRLASEGAKLTQHIAAAPLCSPSRAAFLTGRYPVRTGVVGVGWAGVFIMNAASGGLPRSEITFASIAQKQGYETALIGKWHLGLNCETSTDHCHHPNKHGFKYFWGFPLTNLRDCHPGRGTVYALEKYLPLRTAAVLLLSTVFLYLSGLLPVPRVWRSARRHWSSSSRVSTPLSQSMCALGSEVSGVFRSAERPFLLFFTFLQVHTALFASAQFTGSSPHGIYGDAVQEVDWSVGQILQTLERLGLSENTLVYLTSDQGAHLEEGTHGGHNGIYKGMSGSGGIRVPGLVRWPRKIRPGLEIHDATSNMDVFPSVVQLSGGQLPQDRAIDGRPLLDLLLAPTQRSDHEFMFHYCHSTLQAVRWSPRNSRSVWKAFYFTPNFHPPNSSGCFHTLVCFCSPGHVTAHDPPLLYDLSRDPSESTPLGPESEEDFHSIVDVMERAAREHRASLQPRESEMTPGKVVPKPWLQPCCSSLARLCACNRD